MQHCWRCVVLSWMFIGWNGSSIIFYYFRISYHLVGIIRLKTMLIHMGKCFFCLGFRYNHSCIQTDLFFRIICAFQIVDIDKLKREIDRHIARPTVRLDEREMEQQQEQKQVFCSVELYRLCARDENFINVCILCMQL